MYIPSYLLLRAVPWMFTHQEIADLSIVCKEWAALIALMQQEKSLNAFFYEWPQLRKQEDVLRAMTPQTINVLRGRLEGWRKVQPQHPGGFWIFPQNWYEHSLLLIDKQSQDEKLAMYRDWAEYNATHNNTPVERTIMPHNFGQILYDTIQWYFDVTHTPLCIDKCPFYKDAKNMSTKAKYKTMLWVTRLFYKFIKHEIFHNDDRTLGFIGVSCPFYGIEANRNAVSYLYHMLYIKAVSIGLTHPWDFCFDGDTQFANSQLKLVWYTYKCFAGELHKDNILNALPPDANSTTEWLLYETEYCRAELLKIVNRKDVVPLAESTDWLYA